VEKQQFRYEPEPSGFYRLLMQVISEHFPDLKDAQIMILQDTKMKKSKGAVVFARIVKATDLTRALTRGRNGGAADIIIFVDKLLWSFADEADKTRIIRHELRHIKVSTKKGGAKKYSIKTHEIEDFEIEVELNADDPGWKSRIGEKLRAEYEALKNAQKRLPL